MQIVQFVYNNAKTRYATRRSICSRRSVIYRLSLCPLHLSFSFVFFPHLSLLSLDFSFFILYLKVSTFLIICTSTSHGVLKRNPNHRPQSRYIPRASFARPVHDACAHPSRALGRDNDDNGGRTSRGPARSRRNPRRTRTKNIHRRRPPQTKIQ